MNDYQYTGLMLGLSIFLPFFILLGCLAWQFAAAVRSDMKKDR
jgi:hypothetical protein